MLHVVPARLDGDESPLLGQDFGRVVRPSTCAWIPRYLLVCYFAISLFARYEWMRDGLSYEPPFMRVVSARWFGNEPAVFD